MKKLLLACLCALSLAACSSSDPKADATEALTEIFTLPYEGVSTGAADEKSLAAQADEIAEKFKDVIAEEKMADITGTIAGYHEATAEGKVTVDKIELKETGESQFSYTVTLKVGKETTETKGAIRLDENGKVVTLKVYKQPEL